MRLWKQVWQNGKNSRTNKVRARTMKTLRWSVKLWTRRKNPRGQSFQEPASRSGVVFNKINTNRCLTKTLLWWSNTVTTLNFSWLLRQAWTKVSSTRLLFQKSHQRTRILVKFVMCRSEDLMESVLSEDFGEVPQQSKACQTTTKRWWTKM